MKLISWNVNGIRAAWGRGLAALLNAREADIYALQEVRYDTQFEPAHIDGYYAYWSLYTKRRGYSGVCCISRTKPLRTWDKLQHPDADQTEARAHSIDFEGRTLTLEFQDFYLVNLYAPSPHSRPERREYRAEWDALLAIYLDQLRVDKPVIVCGDLNATVDERDVHHDNLLVPGLDIEFITTERENLRALLCNGFHDCFRAAHPNAENAFTWWSYKGHDREANRGWRLDYILASDALRSKIIDCKHLSHIHGSDHCPLLLTMDFNLPINAKPICTSIPANAPQLRQVNPKLASKQWTELATMWETVDWSEASQNLAQLQTELATAASARNYSEIARCQRDILQSLDARLLAVRHVCSSSSGPGVDGIVWMRSHEKMLAALTLDPENYRAMCDRIALIRTREGKERRIHIACYHDRAMETLCEMALDPIAEAWADRKSFAFRRGRSMIDMAHYVKLAFTHFPLFRADGSPVYDPEPPEWACIADVSQCYEGISQQWILDHIPLDRHVLQEFLRAGVLFRGELFPNYDGIGIGLAISPTIANMTLDGLQKYLIRRMFPGSQIPDYAGCNMIRYCDDIIVTARSQSDAEEIKQYIAEFLKPRGLELSDKKTKIVNINQGFDFMGRRYVKEDDIVHMYPSEDAIKRFESSLEETAFGHSGSQKTLIEKLNKKLDGWATFHKTDEAADAFKRIDIHLTTTLLRLCRRIHPHWSIERIRDLYWYERSDGQWIFALLDNRTCAVRMLRDVVLTDHIRPKLSINPYLHRDLLKARSEDRAIRNAVGKHRAQWNNQGGRCWRCGLPILRDQTRMLERVDGAKPGVGQYYAYVHLACRDRSIDVIETDTMPDNATDTRILLEALYKETRIPEQRYLPLSAYFRDSRKKEILLSFDEIESILKQPLPAQASFIDFWEETGFGCISISWLENGYELQRVDFKTRKARFNRVTKNTSNINIPDVFLSARVPNEVKHEVEHFLKNIQAKYGL